MDTKEKIEFIKHYGVVYLEGAERYLPKEGSNLLQYYTGSSSIVMALNSNGSITLNGTPVALYHKELQDIQDLVNKLLQVLVNQITKAEVVRIREAKEYELLQQEMTTKQLEMYSLIN